MTTWHTWIIEVRKKPPAKPGERCRWHVTGSGGIRCVMRWSRAAERARVLWHDSLLDGFTPAGICLSSTPQFRRSTSSFSNSRTLGPAIVSLPLNQAWLSHVKLGGKTPEFPRLSELSWVNLWGAQQVFFKKNRSGTSTRIVYGSESSRAAAAISQ